MDNFLDLDIIKTIDKGLESFQTNFLSTNVGQIVDSTLDFGIKSIFPNYIENEIIDIKDALFENGIKGALDEAISSVMNLGKNMLGIVSGNLETVNQIQDVLKKGGIVDAVGDLVEGAINKTVEKKWLNKDIGTEIINGKNNIISNLKENVESLVDNLNTNVDKLNEYCSMWQEAFDNRDIEQLNKMFKKLEKTMNKVIPLQNLIEKVKEIENLQTLISNNGGNFDLSNEALELAKII